MKTNHLSPWEQEEYVLDQRTPEMLRHLTECAGCRAAVGRLEHGVAIFRSAAVEWSSECLATRPQQLQYFCRKRVSRARPAMGCCRCAPRFAAGFRAAFFSPLEHAAGPPSFGYQ